MTCPTCDHTMQIQFQDRLRTIYHCPRCGTMRSIFLGHTDDAVPKLVKRCQKFEAVLAGFGDSNLSSLWYTTGIAESINTPERRTT